MKLVHWFDELRMEDVALVGGKNSSLGEMYRELTSTGIRVPNGFAVSAQAYHYFLGSSGMRTS
jgi:pyruvate,water dikinase